MNFMSAYPCIIQLITIRSVLITQTGIYERVRWERYLFVELKTNMAAVRKLAFNFQSGSGNLMKCWC
jgi:hypothetical protein